ncbi:MAG: hypothetical protein AB1324_04230 [Candidatus Micrarchaeota archaeon]
MGLKADSPEGRSPEFWKNPLNGFNEEAHRILREGTKAMLDSSRDRSMVLSLFDCMNAKLDELVERYDPPQDVRDALKQKVSDRIEIFWAQVKKRDGVERGAYWESEKRRVASIILSSLRLTEDKPVGMKTVKQDAIEAMCLGSFDPGSAERLVSELATHKCRSLKEIMGRMEDNPAHMDFLRLLQREGTPRAKKLAEGAMNRMMPESKMPLLPAMAAKVIHAEGRFRPGLRY